MCGIAGAFFRSATISFPIHVMLDALTHRGPDDEGYLLCDLENEAFEERGGADTHPGLNLPSIHQTWPNNVRLVMGHRRLAIIDLSEAGHQPMPDQQKRSWIVYNGELFNYLELRAELEKSGVHFHSQTDTEVILEAYKAWGKTCLNRFNGMWAFALWDSKQKILFCARDRFGVKPFYYVQTEGNFYFASEIKALLLLPQISRVFSEEAVFDYLALSRPYRSGQTFFQNIRALEPGCSLLIGNTGQVKHERWYFFPEAI